MSIKKIEQAITDKKTISFYYQDLDGASGHRFRAQPVALGVSQANNLVVRAWVKPPSVSKSGLRAKGSWRLFLLNHMGTTKTNPRGWTVSKPGYNKAGDKGMKMVLHQVDKPKPKKR